MHVVLGGSVLASSRSILLDFIADEHPGGSALRRETSLCTTRPVVGAALAGLALAGRRRSRRSRLRGWLDEAIGVDES